MHQREFDVLPKAWSLLVTSYNAAAALTSPLQTHPDISRMTPPQLDEFLSNSDLAEWQKGELKNADDKNRYYQRATFWLRLNPVRRDFRKSALFLRRKGIFITPTLKDKFSKIEELLWNALSEYELNNNDAVWPKRLGDQDKLRKEGEFLMKALEKEVQDRLWDSEKLA